MSLDFYLQSTKLREYKSLIFVSEDGEKIEFTQDQFGKRFPGQLPYTLMEEAGDTVFSINITHNLRKMAREAGIEDCLWQPTEAGFTYASELIGPLTAGLASLKASPACYGKFNSPNGWGKYEDFVKFVCEVLEACRNNPSARVGVWA